MWSLLLYPHAAAAKFWQASATQVRHLFVYFHFLCTAAHKLLGPTHMGPALPLPPFILAEAKGKVRLTMSFSLMTLNSAAFPFLFHGSYMRSMSSPSLLGEVLFGRGPNMQQGRCTVVASRAVVTVGAPTHHTKQPVVSAAVSPLPNPAQPNRVRQKLCKKNSGPLHRTKPGDV